MPQPNVVIRLILPLCLLAILVAGCKQNAGVASNGKPVKWVPYNEKSTLADQALRARLKVERREALTNTLTDTGEVWFASEVVLYNAYGLQTLAQEMDQAGTIVKETRNDYRDSLIVRQAVTEGSGYSSAIEFTYNDKNQKVGELLFQRGDSVLRRSYKVDAVGNETEVALQRFRDGSRFELVTERDDLGRPAKVREMQGGKANWSEVYTLSDSLWRIQRSDSLGKLQSDYEMRFDASGAIARMVNRTPDGKTRLQVEYVNDKHGRPLKESFFGANGQQFQTYEYLYNNEGLLMERRLSTPNQPFVLITKYTYSFRR
ncbi:MAG TPA: hypothetical protein VHS96_13495 [Bacteroidia bacterium]|nr:hypothetical protein [Bacteroidia bacterium]